MLICNRLYNADISCDILQELLEIFEAELIAWDHLDEEVIE